MFKQVLLGSVAVLVVSGVAVAGDLPSKASSPAPVMKANKVNWTGVFVGAGGGMNFYDPDASGHIYETDANPDYIVEDDLEQTLFNAIDSEGSVVDYMLDGNNGAFGGIGTGEFGFDYQVANNVVIGLVANYDFGSTTASQSVSAAVYGDGIGGGGLFDFEGAGIVGAEISSQIGNSWGIGARIGTLITDSTLIYGIGGYSMADIETSGRIFAGPIGDEPMSMGIATSDWQNGYFVGGGVETMITSNLSFKMEYRYSQYESQNVWTALDDCGGDCSDDRYWSATEVTSEDPSTHAIRAVLAFRLNGL